MSFRPKGSVCNFLQICETDEIYDLRVLSQFLYYLGTACEDWTTSSYQDNGSY